MIPSASDLLRVLGSGVVPDGGAPPAGETGGVDFQTLLAQARAGSLDTGLPVTIADGVDLDLSDEQLVRLGRVVDRAHAEGASRIVVMMDGQALDVDVLSRRVLGETDLAGGRVVTGIDGFVSLAEGEDDEMPVLPLPGGAVDASVLELLAGGDQDAA